MGNAMANAIQTSTTLKPTSTLMNCGPPPTVNDASVNVIYKSVANYTCNAGYNMTGSPTNMTCDQGNWVGFPPTCDPGFLDIDPYESSGNVPLWLALTLAAVGTTAVAVTCCCIAAVIIVGKNRKRQKVANVEQLSPKHEKTGKVSSEQNKPNTQTSAIADQDIHTADTG